MAKAPLETPAAIGSTGVMPPSAGTAPTAAPDAAAKALAKADGVKGAKAADTSPLAPPPQALAA